MKKKQIQKPKPKAKPKAKAKAVKKQVRKNSRSVYLELPANEVIDFKPELKEKTDGIPQGLSFGKLPGGRKKYTKLVLISAGDKYHIEMCGDELQLAKAITSVAKDHQRFRRVLTMAINFSLRTIID